MNGEDSMGYIVKYEDGQVAGYTFYDKTLLWKGGNSFEIAIFSNIKEAKEAIERTNQIRKQKGWEEWKFKIFKNGKK